MEEKQNPEDEIISEFLHSIGKWNEFVVIGGGFALFIYKLYLTDPKLNNFPIGTRDIDSLIPRRLPKISQKNLATHLLDAGFTPIFKNLDMPAAESYAKMHKGIEMEIEFLTDSATRGDKNKNVLIAGIVAQPLSYITLSLERTLGFETYSKKNGRVVSPGAWMFHKGLTFPKRKGSLKILKDLYGIWYVTTQLGSFSQQATKEFDEIAEKHTKWFESLKKNLQGWLANATPADWSKLETQDPTGRLKKLNFERAIKALLDGQNLLQK